MSISLSLMLKRRRNTSCVPTAAATTFLFLIPKPVNFWIIPAGRGMAAVHPGFTLSYMHTGDKSFLDTAKLCAQYCISNLAVNDWLPLVDYRAPEKPVKYDSTAGMITAAGLLTLADQVGEYEKGLYTKAALRILKACDAKFCNWDPTQDSIVNGGTFFYHDPTGTNTEVPIIYGDYYFIEAIMKLKGKELFIW